MKTIALFLFITINSISIGFSQNNPNEINRIYITVDVEDGINIVKWESSREVNSSYYIIERSLDGKHFELVSTQKAGSSTYHKTYYSFEDISEKSGLAQYRVTLVMMDGSTLSVLSEKNLEENVANAIAE